MFDDATATLAHAIGQLGLLLEEKDAEIQYWKGEVESREEKIDSWVKMYVEVKDERDELARKAASGTEGFESA